MKLRSIKPGLSVLLISSIFALFTFCSASVADTRVHVIGVYEGPVSGAGPNVLVKKTATPVTLILSSYETLSWSVYLEEGAIVEQILINGYEQQYINILDLETFEVIDVPVQFYLDEKVCFPGDSRSEDDQVSFGVYPDRMKSKVITKFLDAVERDTDIQIDREDSIVKAHYTSRLEYIVSDGKIKGKGGRKSTTGAR